jgi:hypothetical protein
MSEPGSQFVYCGGPDVNFFYHCLQLSQVRVSSKSITNVY